MSLFNSVADSLAKKSVSNSISSGVTSALSGIADTIAGTLGGGSFGQAIGNIASDSVRNAATGLYNKLVPLRQQRLANLGGNVLGDILNGDFNEAGIDILNSGFLHELLPGMDSAGSQARFRSSRIRGFGGLTPDKAQQMHQAMRNVELARKNLWMLEVTSAIGGDVFDHFNMLATSVEYSPAAVSGEKVQVGSASIDSVTTSDPTELSMSVMDDRDGTLRSWFTALCRTATPEDGTVTPPAYYTVKIRVLHGIITEFGTFGAYQNVGYFRPVSLQLNLDRSEDGLEMTQITFTQQDSFIKAN